jgi:phospholipid/cholesterol/gamma-HCH transport system ATP-binding protein
MAYFLLSLVGMDYKMTDDIIEIHDLKNAFGDNIVHQGLNLTVRRGEILAILGDSGCGKTTLLRSLLMLHRPTSGTIRILGTDILKADMRAIEHIKKQWGVLFQRNALFGSLTLIENLLFLLDTFNDNLPETLKYDIALLKIVMTGLPIQAATLYPAELSGGMQKRAALARAIVLDPTLLFLDEPTAGLDPKSAEGLDDLILNLRDSLGLTIVMISHELNSLWHVPDRVAFMGEGKILAIGPIKELIHNPHPKINAYFSGHYSEVFRNAAQKEHAE